LSIWLSLAAVVGVAQPQMVSAAAVVALAVIGAAFQVKIAAADPLPKHLSS
jgi:hypothetical protein